MAGLTTHILDTTRGRPASGVEIELHVLGPEGVRTLVARTRTNPAGRTAAAPIGAWGRRGGATRRIVVAEGAACRRDIARRPCSVDVNSRILSRHIISESGRMPYSPAREFGFALNDAARF